MATSGSIDYTVTRDDIITEALQLVGALGEGESPTSNQLTDCSRTLNMMIKYWAADGMKVWINEELVVFPVKNQRQYTFGASGDRMCKESELITTKLNGDHSSSATSLTVDDTTGMAGSDIIGVVTDDSGIHWTTISSVDSSTTLTIDSGLDSTASDNDRVYTYTTAFTQRILDIHNAWIRQTDDNDIPIEVVSKQEYADLSTKTTSGRINQVYFDPKVDTALMNVWQVPDDSYTNERLYLYVSRVFEDFDAAGNNPRFSSRVAITSCVEFSGVYSS